MKRICIVLLLFLSSSLSHADMTGAELFKFCKSDERTDEAICAGYIGGAYNMSKTYQALLSANHPHLMPIFFCVPDDLEPEQLIEIFANHAFEHPKSLEKSAIHVFYASMMNAYQCE